MADRKSLCTQKRSHIVTPFCGADETRKLRNAIIVPLWAKNSRSESPSHKKTPMRVFFAVRTRLELATYGVTGRYSNQLNYRTG